MTSTRSAVGLVVRYLRLRRSLARRLPDEPLDVVLASIEDFARARPATPPVSLRAAARLIGAAERIAGRLTRGSDNTCLYRALARYGALGANGVDPTFVLGLPDDLTPGHAWVEVEGQPFCEPGTPRFIRALERRWPPASL